MPVKIDPDASITASAQNRQAGNLVRRARDLADMPQGEFANEIARRLGMKALSQSAVSDWELGKRQVPAAALIAAAQSARIELGELVATDARAAKVTTRLLRDMERLIGSLTPEQESRLRAMDSPSGDGIADT